MVDRSIVLNETQPAVESVRLVPGNSSFAWVIINGTRYLGVVTPHKMSWPRLAHEKVISVQNVLCNGVCIKVTFSFQCL